jgi:S1-C subfamily serine protease
MRLSRYAILALAVVWIVVAAGCGVCGLTTRTRRVEPVATEAPPAARTPTPRPQVLQPTRPPVALPTAAAGDLTALAEAYEQVLIDVYARSRISVVNVSVGRQIDLSGIVTATPEAHGGLLELSEGSGWVYDEQGHIITNHHVIDEAVTIEVILADGNAMPAKVIGSDKDSDLAVLTVDAPAAVAPPLPLGNSAGLKVGQRVLAIGNPFGLDHTMTSGIVSSLGRVIARDTGYSMAKMIQTDAAINPGNSGGPLLDLRGRVIGVNSMIFSNTGSSAGVGFAIPIDIVKRVAPALIASGKYEHPWLGVSGTSLDSRLARALGLTRQRGALINQIIAGGPAEAAGLRGGTRSVPVPELGMTARAGGDIIIGLDDCPVNSFDDLITCIENTDLGQTVAVRVIRDGEEQTFKATLTKRPER